MASYKAFNFADPSLPIGYTLGSITAGPDGALWFCADQSVDGVIGRITTSGVVSSFSGPRFDTYPVNIAAGPDQALWYTAISLGGPDFIERLTTTGVSTQYALPGTRPDAIASGPDAAMWFTQSNSASLGRLTSSGDLTQLPLPVSATNFDGITTGPDGALWFTSFNYNAVANHASAGTIGRITTTGAVRTYPLPTESGPGSITTGPDGALWLAEEFGGHIGRITTAGSITRFALPSATTGATSIVLGHDGALWFIESPAGFSANAPGTSQVARMTTAGVVTEFPIPELTNAGALTAGPDGALWITSTQIWRLQPAQ